MEDEVYNSVYTYDRLYKELIERIKSGFGKIYIIRDKKGNILASQATYAETNDMVVISGLVTSGRVRGLGFGPMLTTSVLDLNYKENKRVLAFINVDNIESVTMHKRLGYDFLGLYARLIKE